MSRQDFSFLLFLYYPLGITAIKSSIKKGAEDELDENEEE